MQATNEIFLTFPIYERITRGYHCNRLVCRLYLPCVSYGKLAQGNPAGIADSMPDN
ncbi:MAG: hypothetical protein Q4D32_10625 [Eubacteriales bacterium]|nr:hypothetical protein [Eubacteriales bacterium]